MESAVKSGAGINDFDANKQTALISVSRWPVSLPGVAETIRWLLDHGADPNLKGESGFQDLEGIPLHLFVAMNKSSLGGIPNQPDMSVLAEYTLLRMLKAGAKISGIDSAEILIREGAKVMPRDNTGRTPLDYAESAPMIKLLKQNGATER
jgi:ankyrin repeat protein